MSKDSVPALEMLVNDNELTAYIEPGQASFSEVLGLCIGIKGLYEIYGLKHENLHLNELIKEEVPESEYDIHAGTKFSNTESQVRTPIFPRYVKREEVYQAVQGFAPTELFATIKDDLEDRYPESRFEDEFPYAATLNALLGYSLGPERA